MSKAKLVEVTRHITAPVSNLLWGRAAGRCEFEGHNKPLWKSSVTQDLVNIAQRAHIWSFSSDGPRGNEGIDPNELNGFDNLLLLCHECHELIDKEKDGGKYTVALLQAMKEKHERRIEITTGVDANKKSQIVLYWANIGDHSALLNYTNTAEALFPDYWPFDDKPISLGTVDGVSRDNDPDFWTIEAANLKAKFAQRINVPYATGNLPHLSIFGLAPQPLLILLGSLVTDIPPCEVFQLHREPKGWRWPTAPQPSNFQIIEPRKKSGVPALVVSLSATITADRITSVLGEDVAIWTITIPTPNNDFLKSRQQLADYRTLLRPLLDKIKAIHGQTATLNIFPAMPVSAAVELGRVRMPKADMSWQVFDQVAGLGGFVPAVTI
jgi:hypothetical protein